MGILRLLLRALSGSRRPKRVEIRRETVVVEDLRPQGPRVAVRQTTQIRVVEVQELRGRAWVIDGDTLDINGTRIRLAGIDAPEMDHPYGKTAKWALVNLCKGSEVRAVFDGDLSHDRTVATCYLPDGRDLSAEMVKAGMAVDWPKFSRGKYAGLEQPGIRKKLWRCDARQKGRLPPTMPD
jgi:micrococcal nuclease